MSCNKKIERIIDKMQEGTGIILFDFESTKSYEHFADEILSEIKSLSFENINRYYWLMHLLRESSQGRGSIWGKKFIDDFEKLDDVAESSTHPSEYTLKMADEFSRYILRDGLNFLEEVDNYNVLKGKMLSTLKKIKTDIDYPELLSIKTSLFQALIEISDTQGMEKMLRIVKDTYPNDKDDSYEHNYFFGRSSLENAYMFMINKNPFFIRNLINDKYDINKKVIAFLLMDSQIKAGIQADSTMKSHQMVTRFQRAIAANLPELKLLCEKGSPLNSGTQQLLMASLMDFEKEVTMFSI